MHFKRLVSSLAFVAAPALAAPLTYTIDPGHTNAGFEVGHMGLSLQHGEFTQVSGSIVLDPDSHSGRIDVTIDANSLTSDYPARDSHLKGESFFNVAKYPTLTFSATLLKFDGVSPGEINGNLTLLGVTRPVALRVTHFAHAINPMDGRDSYGVNADAWIKRSDFGMTAYLPLLSDDVNLHITVEAAEAKAPSAEN
ncbi:YceI family protein [Paludibacterium yongneupense]|uniref:YceI family protein n=1 Tax=Paludibacterium yongneupense TaxID=400061 RepID=UPI00042177B2|nr:YceI family protein [Paludibacterium yongneupense]